MAMPQADSYTISPDVEGTQVFRAPSSGLTNDPGFLVRCCCGFKAGWYVGAEMAEYVREQHEAACLWPKS